MAGGGGTSTDCIPGTFIPRRTCVSVIMKQQEGDIDLCAILILGVGSVDNALYARGIFLVSVMIITACAKDDAANMNGKQDSLPQKSPPVAAPEWYPTPKRSSGPAGYSAAPSATPPGSQFIQDRQTTRQAPAAGVSAGMTDKTQQYQWPSDQKSAKYSPWNTGQAPAQTPGGPATTGSRRPWGNVDRPVGATQPQQPQNVWQFPGGQPAWGTGDATQPMQPGVFGQYPQGFPGYVW